MHVQQSLFTGWPVRRYRGRPHRRDEQAWRTAVHEAGHAVVAHLLKVPFRYVTIRPSLGHVLGHLAGDFAGGLAGESVKNGLAAVATVLVAGEVAEERLAFVPNRREILPGSGYETLNRLLGGEEVPEDKKRTVVLAIEQMAGDLLKSPAIEVMVLHLAVVLTKRITLNHEEAVRAVTGELR